MCIRDRQKVEHGGSMRGMGLLPARTVFEPQKTRSRVEGSFLPADGLFSAMAGSGMEAVSYTHLVYNLKILHAQTRSSFDCIFYHLLRLAHCVSGCKVTTFK